MKRTTILILLAAALFAAGCSLAEDVTPPPVLATQQAAVSPPQATNARPQPAAVDAAPARSPDLEAGEALYLDRCAPCHGPDGMGQGSMSSNLEIPPTRLGDVEVAASASPGSWYQVVTQGRMERFMPPFSSLSDAQRWDVVAYALTLSTTAGELAEGEALYFEACSKCHAEDGTGIGTAPDLTASAFYSDQTLASMQAVIQDGAEGMPGYGDVYDESQQIALAQYVRSLAASRSEAPPVVSTSEQALEPAAELPAEAVTGSIEGQVVNATTNETLPAGLEVAVVGFDGDTPVFNQSVPVDSDGRYAIDGLEIVPGRIYGAIVEYEGVPYYSTAGHILADAPDLELPLSVYETTPDLDHVQVDRLHLIFDFSVEGVVDVSQLWLISNSGDKTVLQDGGENAIPIALPEGATNLQFSDPAASALYRVTDDGFLMTEPIRPDTPLELIFSFSLPYTSRLDYEQRITLPVSAVVLLAEQNAPDFTGAGLVDTGQQTMGSMALRTYAMAGFEVGETLTLSIRGRSAVAAGPDSNLVIGIGALALALIVTGLGWRQLRSRDDPEPDPQPDMPGGMDREQLLHAIASLDTAFERGELDESAYKARRNTLKTELASLMKSEND